MKKQLFKLILFGLLLFGNTLMAQVTVTGVVTEEGTAEPLIGVSILDRATNNGTITDIDGKYSIEVADGNAVLVFSYVGYEDVEIPVNDRTSLNVTMEGAISDLAEVVVTGYGTQKKSVVTGAISKVKGEDLENMPVVRLEESLQGRTSGVRVTMSSGQPGAGAQVRIRGTTSINGSDPLYVVDNVPIGGGIDFLNQGDIESIEVLKDAAATAIYGTRAANGVILVTTKKGKPGQASVKYNTYFGVQNPWKKLALLDAEEYGIIMNELSVSAGGELLYDDPSTLGVGTDWQDAVFREDAPIQRHEIQISAGSEKSTFYGSFSFFEQEGIVSNEDSRYQRLTARLNGSHKINDWLRFGNSLNYTRNNGVGVAENTEWGSPLGRAINMDPLTPIYETDPVRLTSPVFTNFPVVQDENGVFGISDRVTSEIVNPVAALLVQQGRGWADKVVGNAYVEVEPIKGLVAKSNFGADLAFWGGEGFTPIHYLNATNTAAVTGYSRNTDRGLTWLWENTLTYSKVFGSHDLTLVGGFSGQKTDNSGIGGSVNNLPVDRLEDASLNFPTNPEDQFYWGYEFEKTIASYFGRINYNYQQKYLLTVNYRIDGSSNFGDNNKWGHFPGISVGWVLTEEDFLSKSDIFKFLKLRASYGVNGSDNIRADAFLAQVTGGRFYTFGVNDDLVNGVAPGSLSNPDLRWEQTTQVNFGIDARLFRHISLTLDLYDKQTDDILMGVTTPAVVGNDGLLGNVGSMENKGFELELGYNRSFNALNFSFTGNISYNENTVIYLNDEREFLFGQRFGPQGLEITRTTVGYPIGYHFGYKTDGIFQSWDEVNSYLNADGELIQPEASPGDFRFQDLNGDGLISDEDRDQIGDPTPAWTYGFNLRLEYKGFDFTLFGQGVWGNDIFNATRRFDLPMSNYTADALGRWTGEGTSNTYPRLTLNDPNKNFSRSSDFFVESGAFFRIKTLQIGYTLPKTLTERVKIKNLRIYLTANNFWTFTGYSGFDPEIGASFGVDRGIYPQARFYLVGVNVTL